jgi:LPS-assembly protein
MLRSGGMATRAAERAPWTWAALAAAFAVSASPLAFAQEIAPTQPQTAAQDEAVLLEADELIDDQAAGTVTAQGDVQVRYQGRTMRADRLIYNLTTGSIHAMGNVQIALEDGSISYADEVEADEGLNVAVASELRARLGNSGTLAARAALRHGEGESELRNVIYTSCPICEAGDRPPTWSLRARRAIQDRETRTISYQGAVFELAGMPILYLPYFAHPDPSAGRTSGFLAPNVGRNRRLGVFYGQPYYWAISPHNDLTATLRLHETVNPLIGLDFRQRFWSGQVNINATVTSEALFDSSGNRFGREEWRSSVFADGEFRINDYWQWGFGLERITDDDYLRRYDVQGSGDTRGPYIGNENRLISQLFAIGQNANSYSSVAFATIQGLRAADTPDLLPTIAPYAETEHVFLDPLLRGQVRVQTNLALLERDDNPATVGLFEGNTGRLSVGATWRKDLIVGPGMVFSPFTQVRADLFSVETTANEYESFSRALGLAGAEISWPFMRPGESFDVIVEPVVMAAYGSEDSFDPRIVNEDSLGFELDDSNLFRPNAAPNYDLWEPGGRVSAGVRATARARTGESASMMLGRRWRDQVDPAFTPRTNMDDNASDWVAAGQIDLGRHFSTEVRARLNDETLDLERIDWGVRGAVGRFSGAARYFQYDEAFALDPNTPTEEIYAQVGVEIARGWRMQAGLTRDLDSDINLRQDIRAIYEDDCTFLEISYTRRERQTSTQGPDEGIQIRIGLRSLGVFGGS